MIRVPREKYGFLFSEAQTSVGRMEIKTDIRRAEPSDARAISEIWSDMIRETAWTFTDREISPEMVATLIAEREDAGFATFIAKAKDKTLGFVTYSQFRNGPGYAYAMEHTIVLDPTLRGHGAGRALMEALHTHAEGKGYHTMVAGISSANPGGVAFHSALGYREIARIPEVGRKWDTWLDLILMQKMLGAQKPL